MELLTFDQVLQRCVEYDDSLAAKGKGNRLFTVEEMAKEIFEAQFPKHFNAKNLSKSTIRSWKIGTGMQHTIRRIADKSESAKFDSIRSDEVDREEIKRRIVAFKATKVKDNHQKYDTNGIADRIAQALEGVRPDDIPQTTLCYWMHKIGISTHGISQLYNRKVESKDAREQPQDSLLGTWCAMFAQSPTESPAWRY